MARMVRVAAAQPLGYPAKAEEKHIAEAVQRIQEAADAGAQIVLLPEGYPGPFYKNNRFDGITPIGAKAKETGLYVISGAMEPLAGEPGAGHIVAYLFGPDGRMLTKVVRAVPKGPFPYARWAFNYVGGNEPTPIIDLPFGKIAIVICGELLVPEVARTLALQGAEIIFNPTGDPGLPMQPGFRSVAAVRAVENSAWVVACQQLSHPSDPGFGGIFGPNGPAVLHQGPGVVTYEINLDELNEFRHPDPERSPPLVIKGYGIAGLLHWRRPERWDVLSYK